MKIAITDSCLVSLDNELVNTWLVTQPDLESISHDATIAAITTVSQNAIQAAADDVLKALEDDDIKPLSLLEALDLHLSLRAEDHLAWIIHRRFCSDIRQTLTRLKGKAS